ncbi:mechanosensitive ion channel protein 8 [Phtheirospermum japonicum]|uniref:Mechanosensitive ion channel protein 8 n=1 Tax=Phtheirospermum japonicum TaxID=374723 RepID=A0A830CJ19_9LAMI|nr:mechanosensitive ion channel protein 8 [Phtheirospermum japonicum]
MRTRTKSRLLDPPPDQRSQTQQGASEIDEDDPFLEDDLPDDYKKMKFNALSILQLLSLILIIAALVCSLTINIFKRIKIVGLELWKWELMVLVLISGRLVSGWAIRIVVFSVERNFLLRKRVLYFVYGLRNAVQNCVWLSLVLVAWQCIFDKKVEKVTKSQILPYVTKIWVCLLVGTLVWLLKTLIVKVLASSFHVSTFFDRIQEALFNQYVIETLSGPPLVEIQHEQEEEEKVLIEVQKLQSAGATIPPDLKANIFPKSGRLIGTPRKATPMAAAGAKSPMFSKMMSRKDEQQNNGITIDHLHRLNQKNVSAWNMKRLMNIVRNGVVSTLDEKIQGSTGDDETMVHITSEHQARAAAKKIFNNVTKLGSKYIYEDDLLRFMREDEVLKTMRLFEDGSEQMRISRKALKNWVVRELSRYFT